MRQIAIALCGSFKYAEVKSGGVKDEGMDLAMMAEACCFNYLNEFRNHVRTCYQRAPEAPLPPPVVIKQDDEAQRPGEDQHLRPMAGEACASDASHDSSRSDAAEALIQAASAAY